ASTSAAVTSRSSGRRSIQNKLEVPEVFKLFEVLKCFGYNCEHLPLSIEDAIEELTRTIETGDGHIHLHIHEHTHDDVAFFPFFYQTGICDKGSAQGYKVAKVLFEKLD
ncbi:MAG: hypothetical protein R6U40_06425, partial [Desulfobacterales bacterium]